MRTDLHQLLGEVDHSINLAAVLEKIRERNLQQGQLVGYNLEVRTTGTVCEEGWLVAQCHRLPRLQCKLMQLLHLMRQLLQSLPRGNKFLELLLRKVSAEEVHAHQRFLFYVQLELTAVAVHQFF